MSTDAASITRHFGHVIDVLRTMGAASVQCVATSPPYFGLRDYGVEPVIWEPVLYAPMAGLPPMPFPAHANPEAFATCAHDWDEWSEKHRVEDAVHGKTRTTDRFYGGDANLGDSYARRGGTDKGVSPTASIRSTQNTLEQKGGRKQSVPSGLKAKDLIGIPDRKSVV